MALSYQFLENCWWRKIDDEGLKKVFQGWGSYLVGVSVLLFPKENGIFVRSATQSLVKISVL